MRVKTLSVNQIWYFKIKAWCGYPSIPLTLILSHQGRGKKEKKTSPARGEERKKIDLQNRKTG
jgi:hypothetical protein